MGLTCARQVLYQLVTARAFFGFVLSLDNRILLCGPGWTGIQSSFVASVSQVLRWQAYTTNMSGAGPWFFEIGSL